MTLKSQNRLAKSQMTGQYRLIRPDGRIKAMLPNDVTQAGIDYIFKSNFGFTSQITHWYIGLLTNFARGQDQKQLTEFVGYSGDRPRWLVQAAQTVNGNTLSEQTFTAAGNINGMFLTTQSTKGDMTGLIFSFGFSLFAIDVNVNDTYIFDYTALWP